MTLRRFARPGPASAIGSVEERLATALVPQYAQTGVKNSTDTGTFASLMVSGVATIHSLDVGSTFTVQSSALKSMAFQSATGVSITGGLIVAAQSTSVLITGSSFKGSVSNSSITASEFGGGTVVNSSINSTPIGLTTPSSGKFTDLTVTGNISFGTFVPDLVAAILGYVQIQTSTGGSIKLAAVSS